MAVCCHFPRTANLLNTASCGGQQPTAVSLIIARYRLGYILACVVVLHVPLLIYQSKMYPDIYFVS